MNILLLAPHPFFQERGTPIAVDLLLKALSARGDRVDVLTFHEGADVSYPNVTLHRIARLPGIRNIPPGFSFKKLCCDAAMLIKALRMAKRGRYDLVHAVEESVFMADVIRRLYHIPYVYDMDSCLSQQMVEKHPGLKPLSTCMRSCEKAATRHALAVVAVCDALGAIAREHGAKKVFILRDISLLNLSHAPSVINLRRELNISGTCFMYIGNLEIYQGIDLLLESFSILLRNGVQATLVIVGGKPADIQHYQAEAARLGISDKVHFAGPRPVNQMGSLIECADVMVSPRIKGNNTPMKIYSYLDSGKPLLATEIPSHTQVLTAEIAFLSPARARQFATGMRHIIENKSAAEQLAQNAKKTATEKYSFAAFEQTAGELYRWLDTAIRTGKQC